LRDTEANKYGAHTWIWQRENEGLVQASERLAWQEKTQWAKYQGWPVT
jgi:hypothetical protein